MGSISVLWRPWDDSPGRFPLNGPCTWVRELLEWSLVEETKDTRRQTCSSANSFSRDLAWSRPLLGNDSLTAWAIAWTCNSLVGPTEYSKSESCCVTKQHAMLHVDILWRINISNKVSHNFRPTQMECRGLKCQSAKWKCFQPSNL